MENFNWILMGITAVLAIFVVAMRINDYVQYSKSLKAFKEKEEQVSILIEDLKVVYLYLGLSIFVSVFSWFVGTDFLEKLILSVLFGLLLLSETLNAYIVSRLYVSTKAFLLGVTSQKFRSIRHYVAKGKRHTRVMLLNNQEITLTNAFSEALQLHIKSIKGAKK
jgi:hypothetical protein